MIGGGEYEATTSSEMIVQTGDEYTSSVDQTTFTTSKSSNKTGKLPQTGQNWMIVIVMGLSGCIMIIIGIVIKKDDVN